MKDIHYVVFNEYMCVTSLLFFGSLTLYEASRVLCYLFPLFLIFASLSSALEYFFSYITSNWNYKCQ